MTVGARRGGLLAVTGQTVTATKGGDTVRVSRATLTAVEDLAAECDATINYRYSGRGMFGDECLALETNDVSGLVRFTLGLAELVAVSDDVVADEVSGLVDLMRDARTRGDQLGPGVVYYWPTVNVEQS